MLTNVLTNVFTNALTNVLTNVFTNVLTNILTMYRAVSHPLSVSGKLVPALRKEPVSFTGPRLSFSSPVIIQCFCSGTGEGVKSIVNKQNIQVLLNVYLIHPTLHDRIRSVETQIKVELVEVPLCL